MAPPVLLATSEPESSLPGEGMVSASWLTTASRHAGQRARTVRRAALPQGRALASGSSRPLLHTASEGKWQAASSGGCAFDRRTAGGTTGCPVTSREERAEGTDGGIRGWARGRGECVKQQRGHVHGDEEGRAGTDATGATGWARAAQVTPRRGERHKAAHRPESRQPQPHLPNPRSKVCPSHREAQWGVLTKRPLCPDTQQRHRDHGTESAASPQRGWETLANRVSRVEWSPQHQVSKG